MDMIGRIRRLHSRGKKSEREIARMTGLSRNTVAKWLHSEVDGPPKYRRGEVPGKLKAFEEAIKQALKADARRPKHERRTARALYAHIKAAGYDGGYSRVTDFIRAWRQGEGASRLVIAGALTNWCIRSTAYAALERGYHLALASDAHSTETLQLPNGKTVPADAIVAELNAVLTWVSVPRVRTEVLPSKDVAF